MTKQSLSYLIEAALEKEAVLMASAAITEKLERISKELAKMIADDVIPLGDSMRDLFGADQATSFENLISEKINALLEQVRTARNEISDQIDALKNGEPMNDMAKTGADDMFGGEGDAAPAPEAGAAPDAAGHPAPAGDDPFGMDNHDDGDAAFGGQAADPGFDPHAGGGAAGRPQKESHRSSKKIVESSADRRLTKQFAKLIREGKSASGAVRMIAESYALDVATVVDIITKVKKG